jgi:hypothetical protein
MFRTRAPIGPVARRPDDDIRIVIVIPAVVPRIVKADAVIDAAADAATAAVRAFATGERRE